MKVLVTGGSGFIGNHLMAHLLDCGHEIMNLDWAAPGDKSKISIWRNCSILDANGLRSAFREFQPQGVIHLAAYTAMEGRSLNEYRANTDGVANVLNVCKESEGVQRLIITSTQHVRQPGSGPPKSDTDYAPFMLYGESKVITEQLTRAAKLDCAWTIIRPTAVWGPGHVLLADGLWKLIARGKYVHPSRDPVIRSYGYVKNVAWQIEKLLQTKSDAIKGKMLYVADGNMRQSDWINAFARKLTGREVRTLPVGCIHLLAKVGDGLRAVGLRFPMYSLRFRSLATPNPVPIEPTLELLGQPPYSLEQGVEATADWLKSRLWIRN